MSTARRRLLVVDDEELFCRAVCDELASEQLEVDSVGTLQTALRLSRERPPDIVLLDQHLPDGMGADLCPELLALNDAVKIVFVTAYPNFDNALTALRRGAFDYLSKPCDPLAVRHAVERALRTQELERGESARALRREREASHVVVADLPGGAALRESVALAASSSSPVLLSGETGTGKTFLAKAIHYAGARRDGEFVSINCAALPEALIEAELLGHERGAFTGAVGARPGLFELADGGSILLDELAEMPALLQARLLEVVESREVRRLGGRSARRVDFRVLAATNQDVAAALREQRLRSDLYYRLAVLTIHLPPLRERLDELPALVERLVRDLAGAASTRRLAPGELERLAAYRWPGNLRELRNVLERALLLAPSGELRPSALLASEAEGRTPSSRAANEAPLTLAEVERRQIETVLARCAGNLAQAARALGVSVSTLQRKRGVAELARSYRPARQG